MRFDRYALCGIGVVVVGLALCKLSIVLTNHGFDEYDMSPMIDSGWRVYSGQVPGRDFMVTFPPSLYLLTALCFRVFGVTWHGLALGACWFYAAILALGLRLGALVRKTQGPDAAAWTVSGYFVAVTIPFFIMNVLWHSSLSMQFGTYAVYATYVLATTPATGTWIRREAMAHLTLAIAGLLLSKVNTAFPAILLCLWVAYRSGVRWRGIALMVASALVLVSAVLATIHLTLLRVLLVNTGLTGRLIPKALITGILYNVNSRTAYVDLLGYAVLAPALIFIFEREWPRRQSILSRPIAMLAVGSILVSLIGMATNLTFKVADMSLAAMGITFLIVGGGVMYTGFRRRATWVLFALFFTTILLGRTKLAFKAGGGWLTDVCSQINFDDPFFGRTKTCLDMPAALNQVDRVLQANPGAHVFFGPSMEFFYAARKIQSPLHLPNWWDPGTSFPLAKADQVAAAWRDDRFDLLIFKNNEDRVQMPAKIGDAIDEGYECISATSLTHVYRRRLPGAENPVGNTSHSGLGWGKNKEASCNE